MYGRYKKNNAVYIQNSVSNIIQSSNLTEDIPLVCHSTQIIFSNLQIDVKLLLNNFI